MGQEFNQILIVTFRALRHNPHRHERSAVSSGSTLVEYPQHMLSGIPGTRRHVHLDLIFLIVTSSCRSHERVLTACIGPAWRPLPDRSCGSLVSSFRIGEVMSYRGRIVRPGTRGMEELRRVELAPPITRVVLPILCLLSLVATFGTRVPAQEADSPKNVLIFHSFSERSTFIELEPRKAFRGEPAGGVRLP